MCSKLNQSILLFGVQTVFGFETQKKNREENAASHASGDSLLGRPRVRTPGCDGAFRGARRSPGRGVAQGLSSQEWIC